MSWRALWITYVALARELLLESTYRRAGATAPSAIAAAERLRRHAREIATRYGDSYMAVEFRTALVDATAQYIGFIAAVHAPTRTPGMSAPDRMRALNAAFRAIAAALAEHARRRHILEFTLDAIDANVMQPFASSLIACVDASASAHVDLSLDMYLLLLRHVFEYVVPLFDALLAPASDALLATQRLLDERVPE